MKQILLYVMAAFYVFAGAMHFIKPAFYLRIVPPWMPWPAGIVVVSGVAEILLGVALLVPSARVYAAWGVIALLVAVFPANVHAATASIQGYGGYARLPFQVLFIVWAWWYTVPDAPT